MRILPKTMANLLAVGNCARWDGEETDVKNTNDWSENYARVGEGS
jgi:hypothetical protein